MRRTIRTSITVSALVLVAQVSIAAGPAAAAPAPDQASSHTQVSAVPTGSNGSLGAAATHARAQGYLVPDQAGYDAVKQAALQQAAVAEAPAPAARTTPPTVTRNFEGVRNSQVAPSDSTGAIGPTRYIELINSNFGIYNRTSDTPVGTGTLNQLVGSSSSASVFDPQVMWDPGTNRFYYATDLVVSSTQNFLAFGFSKTDTPDSAADFCQYTIGFGADFPDYPKLGDTQDFLLIGSNHFSAVAFEGAFVQWIDKPAAGTSCPAASSLSTASVGPLRDADGQLTETPVPANQTDDSTTGYVMTRANSDGGGSDNFLTLFPVTTAASGDADIPTTGQRVRVPAYSVPAAAPQQGVTQRLDTLDARLTQAVSAIDPARDGAVGLWTQHTVQGGAGSQVRWYEIDVSSSSLYQGGKLSSPSLWVFNGAVSPDRAVLGSSARFGSNMVAQAATTSSSTTPTVMAVSKRGSQPVSRPITIVTSPASYVGFDCPRANSTCRWGDYAGATPDPVVTDGATAGQVWISGQYANGNQSTRQANWVTRNAAIAV